MATDEPVIRATWKGGENPTEFHHGIPARNLTQEDYLALDLEHRRTVRQSPLYGYVMAKDLSGAESEEEDQEPESAAAESSQPEDPVTTEPAVAAEEGETS